MKKLYNQPEVLVTRISLESMVLAGSSASAGGDQMSIGGSETSVQW